ncbi:MAG: helix-turn-helix domain-containing protein, partial [Roseococcus sp.]
MEGVSAPGREERPGDNPKNQVQSVAKAFAVLQAFTPGIAELTVAEVAARAGLDRGTAFRLIHTLLGLGFLRPAEGRRFRLALKCLELGHAALSAHGLGEHALPLLQALVPGIADAGSLGALEEGEVVYLVKFESASELHQYWIKEKDLETYSPRKLKNYKERYFYEDKNDANRQFEVEGGGGGGGEDLDMEQEYLMDEAVTVERVVQCKRPIKHCKKGYNEIRENIFAKSYEAYEKNVRYGHKDNFQFFVKWRGQNYDE